MFVNTYNNTSRVALLCMRVCVYLCVYVFICVCLCLFVCVCVTQCMLPILYCSLNTIVRLWVDLNITVLIRYGACLWRRKCELVISISTRI